MLGPGGDAEARPRWVRRLLDFWSRRRGRREVNPRGTAERRHSRILRRALHAGGILLAYTPQVTQAVQLRETLAESAFGMAETIEVLQRGWHIEGQSVRPDHRMVAHTGFLTHARLVGSPP